MSSKFSRDTIFIFASQLIVPVCGFGINLAISFSYGSAALGTFSQVFSLYLLLSTISSLGLNTALIKLVATEDEGSDQNIIFSNILIILIFITLIFSAFTHYAANSWHHLFSSEDTAYGIRIVSISLPVYNFNKLIMSLLLGVRNMRLFSIIKVVRWLLLLGIMMLISIITNSTIYLYYSIIISELLLMICTLFLGYRHMEFDISIAKLKQCTIYGIGNISAEVVSIMNERLDIILLGYYLPVNAMGVYSFYIYFVKSLSLFSGAIMQNINPYIAIYWKESRINELKALFGTVKKYNYMVVFVQILAISLVYLIITGKYLPEYSGSFKYFILTSMGYMIFSLYSWSGGTLIMIGKLRQNFKRTILNLFISILCILSFTSQLGLAGAALAVAISYLLITGIQIWFVKRHLKINLITV